MGLSSQPEDRADFVHPPHTGGDGHPLDQLGGLRQCRTLEVVDLENGGTGLGGSGLKFWRLDFGETLRIINQGSEDIGDAGVNTGDGVGDRGTGVDDSVGEAGCLAEAKVVGIVPGELSEGTANILDLERKQRRKGSGREWVE